MTAPRICCPRAPRSRWTRPRPRGPAAGTGGSAPPRSPRTRTVTAQSWITQAAARGPPGPQPPRACDLCAPRAPALHSLTCTAPNIYINIYRSLLRLLPWGNGGEMGQGVLAPLCPCRSY